MMRESQEITAWTTPDEILDALVMPRRVHKKQTGKQKGPAVNFLDCTCTLDIETTNTDADGFMYTCQMCIDGQVVVLRYIEDVFTLLETLADLWHVSGKCKLVLYVHNLGYEFMYLSQMLAARWGIKKALYTASRKPLFMTFDNGIELRDSLKLFQKSLARATEGCKHEKLKGDLDYSVYRTPDTELTQQEFDYCVNDVLGLYEAIERLKAEHNYNQSTIPYTNTGMVIDEVEKGIKHDVKTRRAMKALELNSDQTYIAYSAMAGGDTHGCRWKAGKTFYNCNSYDFKSAHPSQQLLWKFPKGAPVDLPDDLPEDDAQTIIESGWGWIAKVFIKNPAIRPECPDPVISVSRCEDILNNTGEDNGRLLQADGVFLYCDSNDYQRIKEAYTYTEFVMVHGFMFMLDYLPDAFRMTILDKFRIKETMKGHPDYMFSKICVNTIFGACAQKTVRDEYDTEPIDETIKLSKTKWQANLEALGDAEVYKRQEKKFPFLWGLWTASLSRLKLWQLLKIVGWERVIYWDTDSCKFEGPKVPGVDAYNATIQAQCEARGCVVYKDTGNVYIGVAEDEHPLAEYGYKEFRFLHAKCYAARDYHGKLESTIAGVGKRQGVAALHDDIENLNEWLVITDAGGMALTYHDAPIKMRTDFSRATYSASWVVMNPRRYEVGRPGEVEELDIERLG